MMRSAIRRFKNGITGLLLLMSLIPESYGQLVGKRDYDMALALQAGGNLALAMPFHHPEIGVMPQGGLKMTFPFDRKWFIGAEVNYLALHFKGHYPLTMGTDSPGKMVVDAKLRQVEIPVYVKYMLNCNRASVLFGFYGAYALKYDFPREEQKEFDPEKDWNVGLTLGYEYQLVKRLNVMCRVSAGVREMLKTEYTGGRSIFPLQIALTLSYDVLRIGGCGCD